MREGPSAHIGGSYCNVQFSSVPEFLRLDLRKPGLLGKLGPRPILKKIPGAGANFAWLAVPASLTKAVKGSDQVSVSAASLTAFRWYRLRRSSGALFSAVATIVGGLPVALGAAWLGTGIGKALLISGAALTVLAAVVLAISAWRAPVD